MNFTLLKPFTKVLTILFGLLANTRPAERYITVCGNHDTGNEGDVYGNISVFTPALMRFLHFHSTFDEDIRKGYFTTQVNGYNPYVDIIDNDESTGYDTDDYADRVKEILISHKNVFYFCGHWHIPYVTIREEAPSVYYINMPRVASCDEDTGETWEYTGLGVQVAVTDSEVILEGVNFYRCEMDEDRAVVPII